MKNRAPKPVYVSEKQLNISGFSTPFYHNLNPKNRWVILAHNIPWDSICNLYLKRVGLFEKGRPSLNPRVIIGTIIIKHMCNLDDRETVAQISENMYMQYFLGYSSFCNTPPFDPSLLVSFRKKLGVDLINEINEKIIKGNAFPSSTSKEKPEDNLTNKGDLLIDATACPQDIAFPTDLDLLSEAREKTEKMIDVLHHELKTEKKPRTYKIIARKKYLRVAQKKNKTKKEVRKAIGQQLNYVKRNLNTINKQLDRCSSFPFSAKEHKYLLIMQTLYDQQREMHSEKKHSVNNRIVSIHQPHVRPIVRGKAHAPVEFGAKINVSLINGYCYVDHLDWEAYNEGTKLISAIEKYNNTFGFYPKNLLVDKIYCTRENRKAVEGRGIKLKAKPLGRPSAVKKEHVRPGERNPIEGKFGQAKTAYGLSNIRARLKNTSESWIASIILVLNLVKLAGQVPLYLIFLFFQQIKNSHRNLSVAGFGRF